MVATEREVQVIHAGQGREEVASGAMSRLEGVSQALCGAEGIHLGLATIAPGCRSSPHWHVNCESALYVVRGRGRFLAGPKLETSLEIGPGDFIYVPPGAIHAPVNDGTEPLELVVARNAPEEIVREYVPDESA
ncbi:MAG: cupin domain-containing protein [Chloroflexota bacterium]